MYLDKPRGLRVPANVLQRNELLLTAPNVQPLREWSAGVVDRRSTRAPGTLIPNFDPAEAGVGARLLLLLEAPGPMTNAGGVRPGSGFISVDNDDQTAENSWRVREQVGLSEHIAIHWNIVPWYLGPASVKPTAEELGEGAMYLRSLLPLMAELRVVVLAGLYAQRGWAKHVAPFVGDTLTVVSTWHPSPLAINKPGRRDELVRAWDRAARLAG